MAAHSYDLLHDSHGVLMAAASRAVAALYRPRLAPLGLTHPQYLLLLALDVDQPQSAITLARTLSLSPGTLTPVLRRLDHTGYVTRGRDSGDNRSLAVTLTRAGRDLLPALWQVGEDVRRVLSVDAHDTDALRRLIRPAPDREHELARSPAPAPGAAARPT